MTPNTIEEVRLCCLESGGIFVIPTLEVLCDKSIDLRSAPNQ